MKTLQTISRNQLVVLALPRRLVRDVFSLAADIAARGPLRVIDGGNLFNVLTLSRIIRRKVTDVEKALNRIYISRAFTCYQMESMLHDLPTPHNPVLLLDLLNTFYDESVNDQTSQRLLSNCVRHLRRASASAPVLVSIFPPPKAHCRPFLIDTLRDAADQTWQWESRANAPQQMALWSE